MKVLVKNNKNQKYIIDVEEKFEKVIFLVGSISYFGEVLCSVEDSLNSSAKFVRVATNDDENKIKFIEKKEKEAVIDAQKIADKYKLEMKVINAVYDFDQKQLLVEFSAENRVDFRNLAKDLARIYKARIELKQVGVRDKAKIIGGYGMCGRPLCCKGFIDEFSSVSINMAKNQNISLNPNKINGVCGRLLCCLRYENDTYKDIKSKLPKKGSIIKTPKGEGKVIDIDVLNQKYKVSIPKLGVIEFEHGKD